MLGYIKGAEAGQPYRIASQGRFRELLKLSDDAKLPVGLHDIDGARYATRTKLNFAPSSWLLIAYDQVPGMPDAMRYDNPVGTAKARGGG